MIHKLSLQTPCVSEAGRTAVFPSTRRSRLTSKFVNRTSYIVNEMGLGDDSHAVRVNTLREQSRPHGCLFLHAAKPPLFQIVNRTSSIVNLNGALCAAREPREGW